jgi:RNA polymerase sigma factor (sigma-70 family)
MNLFSGNFSDEQQLWRAFKKGDRDAYAQLYDNYFEKLYRYGKKITPDTCLIEDCIQDLFVSLWKGREKHGELQSIKFYLYKSLRNNIVSHIKYHQTQSLEYYVNDVNLIGTSPSPENFIILEEISANREEKINTALQDLTKREREAIFLKFYSGLSSAEISQIMDISIPSVYNLVNKAISQLQKSMDKLLFFICWCLSGL